MKDVIELALEDLKRSLESGLLAAMDRLRELPASEGPACLCSFWSPDPYCGVCNKPYEPSKTTLEDYGISYKVKLKRVTS